MQITDFIGWFGKVYSVPGRFHVATEFFHIGVPLYPFRSYLVVESPGKPTRRTPAGDGHRLVVGTVWKSVRRAWLMGLLLGAAVACVIAVMAQLLFYMSPAPGQDADPRYVRLAGVAFLTAIILLIVWDRLGAPHPPSEEALERLAGRLESRWPKAAAVIREHITLSSDEAAASNAPPPDGA